MPSLTLVLLLAAIVPGRLATTYVDADSDCVRVPAGVTAEMRAPALVVLSCIGATRGDIDSLAWVGDSLGLILATCHRSRNHRATELNDIDILTTVAKLRQFPVDTARVALFGFSGQAVQALATMFLHPAQVMGVIAVCPHSGAMGLVEWDVLAGNSVYLVTRAEDWNRIQCEEMSRLFRERGVRSSLFLTTGQHEPGPSRELAAGVGWLIGRP
jgi:hypothetical protein